MNNDFDDFPDEFYRILFELCPDPMVLVQDGICRVANAAFTELLGYGQADLREGLELKSLLAEHSREAVKRLYQHRVDGGSLPKRSLWEILSKDGKTTPCEVAARMIRLAGSPAVLVTVRETPEQLDQYDMEKLVRSSEARYGLLFSSVLEGIYQTTADGEILTANPALVAMVGYESEEQLRESVRAHQLYADPAERSRLLKQVEQEGVLRNVEYDLICKDGSTITVLESARSVKDDHGELLYYEGMLVDISEKRADEKNLKELNAQWTATLEALPDMLFETDREGRILDFQAPKPERLFTDPANFLDRKINEVLPQPAAGIVMKAISEASQSAATASGVYSLDYPDGTRWFELSVAVKGDPEDSASSLIALVHDITDLKRTEEELRRTAHELEAEKLALKEKNTALHHVLDHLESRTATLMAKAYAQVESAIRPIVMKLFDELPPDFSRKQQEIEQSLDAVFLRDADDFQRRFAGLTSRQSEICRLVAQGLSSKEVSSELNMSPATVSKHRELARRKLGLTGKSISLSSYLRTHLSARQSWIDEWRDYQKLETENPNR